MILSIVDRSAPRKPRPLGQGDLQSRKKSNNGFLQIYQLLKSIKCAIKIKIRYYPLHGFQNALKSLEYLDFIYLWYPSRNYTCTFTQSEMMCSISNFF